MELFFESLKYILPIITILTFIKVVWEYIRSQKWKKSELLSKEVKEFFNDPKIKIVCQLLDWNSRKIDIGDKRILITDEFLIEALKTHNHKSSFKYEEAYIRDLFDNFFDKMSFFNIYINNSLVDESEVINYLSYYLNILAKPGRKSSELVTTINRYIEYYEFKNVSELISRNKKSGHWPPV